jgi:hypothetical protein
MVETGLAGVPSTVTATAGAAEGVVAEGATAIAGVTAIVVVVATTEAAEEADAEERFFFLPASFFNAASAMAWGSFGGGFCPANPAAT